MGADSFWTYEFYLRPEIQAWPWRHREIWTHTEYEEAWRLLNAKGYEIHECERYRAEPLLGWPQPSPTGRDSGGEHREKHPQDVGALLAWLRSCATASPPAPTTPKASK